MDEDLEPAVAPMADMVFLLLAFLVCTAVIGAESDPVRTPESTAYQQDHTQGVYVEVALYKDEQGQTSVALEGRLIPLASLGQYLTEPLVLGRPVQLRADADCAYADIRQVLAAARAARAPGVTILTRYAP